jgi:hypothetical protein
VDIGEKPSYLSFEKGELLNTEWPLVSIPMPLILDLGSSQHTLPRLEPSLIETAARTGLIALIDSAAWPVAGVDPQRCLPHVAFYLRPDGPTIAPEVLRKTRLAEIPDRPDVVAALRKLKAACPGLVVAVRVELTSAGPQRAIDLAAAGVEVIHVVADLNGNEVGSAKPRFIKDLIRQIHTGLIETGKRDEVTIMAGGGIALPEHMAKAIICGADLVTINLPLLVALECRLCSACAPGTPCPANLEKIDAAYAQGRMTNLIAAWHDQLIEVMGAMGMREVRRLRGDVGRAMFFEQLEEESFGKLFGTRRDS